ncbi:alcohol dehydrogenase catalytic domain-containing protein [Pseudonocardia xinjiangensis]|uniref:alcohol dehydrogenase catalytic domain-containing protein n=1 Tax=Pseudonocardia xinjiangensis TaxID=75289 RepID=UPI003D92BBDB
MPSTWIDRHGRDRTPSIPGHELACLVTAVGYGTTSLTVGQRVFGLTDWTRHCRATSTSRWARALR